MKSLDYELSCRIAKRTNAMLGKCSGNVAKALLDCADLLPDRHYYVEGIWYKGGQPNVHAWVETDQAIIDPTLIALEQSRPTEIPKYRSILKWEIEKYGPFLQSKPKCGRDGFDLNLSWDDPRVEAAADALDPV